MSHGIVGLGLDGILLRLVTSVVPVSDKSVIPGAKLAYFSSYSGKGALV